MAHLFRYLDKFYVPESGDLPDTTEQGFALWRMYVFEQFKSTARNVILDLIMCERDGEKQDGDLLRDSIMVYVELDSKLKSSSRGELYIYRKEFHKYLLAQTKRYYTQKSRELLNMYSCPEYLVHVEKCVEGEKGRVTSYINPYSTDGIMAALKDEMLKKHQDEILAKSTGIQSMLERAADDVTVKDGL